MLKGKILSIFSGMTFLDGIAIYAAFVSTVVGIVEIVRLVRELSNKVKVEIAPYDRVLVDDALLPVGEVTNVLAVRIVNHSRNKKFLQRPLFKFNKGNRKAFQSLDMVSPYPLFPFTLGPEEEQVIYFRSATILDEAKSVSSAKKVRVIVTDTLNNSFKSNWVILNGIHP